MRMFHGLILMMFFAAGCARTIQMHEDRRDEGEAGVRALEERFAKSDDEDWYEIVLIDGTTIEGTFFSVGEGVVTLRIGDSFREAELADIARLRYRTTVQTMRFWVYPLAGLAVAFIVYSFSQE